MTEMKQNLIKGGSEGKGRFQSKPQYSNGPVEIQLQKMEERRRKDAEIDEGIEEIIDGIKMWKEGLKHTSQLTNESELKIMKLT